MTLENLKETYGTGVLLNNIRRSTFTRYNKLEETIYKGVQVCIELDRYNDHWIYNSNEVCLSGRFNGTLEELKSYLKEKINKLLSNKE